MEYFLHDTRFTEAFANTDHTVLGKRLHPYCLWHQFNLELIQSPVLVGARVTPLDLWLAVQVCTTRWTPQHRIPDITPPSRLGFLWRVGRFNFSAEVRKFTVYFQDYISYPQLWPNNHDRDTESQGDGDRDMDENFELALHVVSQTTITWPEVWMMPIGMVRWISIGALKLSGAKVDIWTPDHQARKDVHVKKREAKIDETGRTIAAAEGIPYEAARERAKNEYWAGIKATHAFAKTRDRQRSP